MINDVKEKSQDIIRNSKVLDVSAEKSRNEIRLRWGELVEDRYTAEAKFGESSDFEIAMIALKGNKSEIVLDFPFCHFYRLTERELSLYLYQVPSVSELGIEYPLYKIVNSWLVEQVVQVAGGVLEKEELEHYQILSTNIVIDVILYKGEEILIHDEGINDGQVG
ncbi:hypothetical protein [Streptococcus suis]|uniref:hypothetical protein n=1 Tax=Streptococcus suis TaxID=1307 RepID=UPI00209AD976|nr:hypothetical protein [Streptococcus suis]MCO8200111.1 hypothetical protein [Streptococcus suis]MCO8217608.1 hypothetical protein [Streptococcus suis]